MNVESTQENTGSPVTQTASESGPIVRITAPSIAPGHEGQTAEVEPPGHMTATDGAAPYRVAMAVLPVLATVSSSVGGTVGAALQVKVAETRYPADSYQCMVAKETLRVAQLGDRKTQAEVVEESRQTRVEYVDAVDTHGAESEEAQALRQRLLDLVVRLSELEANDPHMNATPEISPIASIDRRRDSGTSSPGTGTVRK
jgi:hypothetical protein